MPERDGLAAKLDTLGEIAIQVPLAKSRKGDVVFFGPACYSIELALVVEGCFCCARGLKVECELPDCLVPGNCVESVRHLIHPYL
jgi:hypothetical protein